MSHPRTTNELTTLTANIKEAAEAHMEDTGGLRRLSPTWVPRSFAAGIADQAASG
jgi:hypothetical protein